MSDNQKSRIPNQEDKNPQGTSSIVRPMMMWIILLGLLPVLFFFSFKKSDIDRTDTLSVSDFELLLNAKRIRRAVVEEQSSSNIQKITGEYWPMAIAPGAAEGLRRYVTKVIYTDSLEALIRSNCPLRDVKQSSGIWSNLLLSLLPIVVLALLFYFFFIRQMRSANSAAFQFGKSRAKLLNQSDTGITLKDVAGITEAKEEMQEIVDYLKAPERFQRLGGRVPRGVLMVGPPGTGKTLLAKAIAGEAGVPFFSISGSDFVEMFVGVGASRVRDMFDEGKKNAPCLIFIDEIDAVGRSRFTGIGGGHDEREQTLNAMLVEMDGFEPNSGVIVLAATNRPDVLDPALLRPGRFDRQVVIDLPDHKGRYEILKIHAKKIKLDKSVDLRQIARGTPGFSGADLANLLNEGAIIATRANKPSVGMPELEEARDKVQWGKERRSRKMTERQRRLTAYHEAGHTLVNLFCEHAEPLHKVTIIPRGMAMGATMFIPENDRYDITENEAIDMMTMGMGGRCAEQLIFNELTSGGSMDIRQATSMAKRMVCEWGMSKALGPLNYAVPQEHVFLGRDITRTDGVSQTTAREIDVEVRRLVDEAETRATKILTDHKDMLCKLAEALLVNETMTAAEVYALLELPPRVLSNEGFEEDNKEDDKEAPQKEVIREMVDLLTAEVEKRKGDKEDFPTEDCASGDNADRQSTEKEPPPKG